MMNESELMARFLKVRRIQGFIGDFRKNEDLNQGVKINLIVR
jgi:ribosomal protein S8